MKRPSPCVWLATNPEFTSASHPKLAGIERLSSTSVMWLSSCPSVFSELWGRSDGEDGAVLASRWSAKKQVFSRHNARDQRSLQKPKL